MNFQFHEFSIKNKSSEEKERWQSHFSDESDSEFYITSGINGILAVISPTSSGKTRAIKRLLERLLKRDVDKAIVIKNDNPTVCEQWKKEGVNSISLHLHDMDLDTFKEKINYDKIDYIIFDEAHEIYSFLFYGHGCHNCHQTEDHIGIFKKRYEKNPNQNILSLATDKKIILLSATMDSLCCEDLPPYSNIVPIDIYVNKPGPDYCNDLPKITKIPNDNESICRQIYEHSSSKDKIAIWAANKSESKKIKNDLIKRGLHKSLIAEFNSEKKNLDNIKLKKVSIFIQGGISGIDDKELKYIFILRPGLNSNDTNNEKDKQNISVGIIQIIGRIRERGGNVYITRDDEINLEKYLQESYNRILSDNTKNNYSFFHYINQYKKDKGYLNEECIKTQRIPGLINNIVKNGKCIKIMTQDTLIGDIKGYISGNISFFDKMKKFLDQPGSIYEIFIEEYLNHIDKVSKIFESHFDVEVSRVNIKYSDKWINKRSLSLTSIKKRENNHELKRQIYELTNRCELRGIKTDIKNLDLAHIKEEKDNGKCNLDNCILIQPFIDNYWDNGTLIIFLDEFNEINIYTNDIYFEEDPDYELIKKNIVSIRETFKRIDLSNLQFRLDNKLSHE